MCNPFVMPDVCVCRRYVISLSSYHEIRRGCDQAVRAPLQLNVLQCKNKAGLKLPRPPKTKELPPMTPLMQHVHIFFLKTPKYIHSCRENELQLKVSHAVPSQ